MHITLANLHLATPQQVFDQVARHLMTQKARSTDFNGHCKYRGLNGLKCAAGCVISDDEYDPFFEGKSWDHLMSIIATRSSSRPLVHIELIGRLQLVHDGYVVSYWREMLQAVAVCFNLDSAILDS